MIDDDTGSQGGQTWNRKLGTDHNEAVGYMSNTREEMEVIMSYVEEVQNDPVTDTLEFCFTDTKRAVAMQAGYAVFDAIDANGDGDLTPEEVSDYFSRNPKLLNEIFSAKRSKVSIEWVHMLDSLDANGDKEVQWEEFSEFWTSNGLDLKEGSDLFKSIDKSGDGSLSTQELKKHLQSNQALRDKLYDLRVQRLHKEWDAFFAMLHDGTNGSLDRTQFASLWSASGLGLNVPPESVQKDAQPLVPRPPNTARLPRSPCQSLIPSPPSRPSPHTARPGSAAVSTITSEGTDAFLHRDAVRLERPCVAKRVDYGALLQEQRGDLSDREKSIAGYQDMLLRVEKYQRQAIRVLEAHYMALGDSSKWRQVQSAALSNPHPFERLLPPLPVGGRVVTAQAIGA